TCRPAPRIAASPAELPAIDIRPIQDQTRCPPSGSDLVPRQLPIYRRASKLGCSGEPTSGGGPMAGAFTKNRKQLMPRCGTLPLRCRGSMRRIEVQGHQRRRRRRTIRSLGVLVAFGCLISGNALTQMPDTDPNVDHDRAVNFFVMGNAEITRGDTRVALQHY